MTSSEKLMEAALAVQRNAYAPYSNFQVGAAILSASGEIFTGCNVENASYGLAICAERSAVCQMVAAGETEIQSICVVSDKGVTPCGACRQVLSEFGGDFEVRLIDSNSQVVTQTWRMAELLPGAFKLK